VYAMGSGMASSRHDAGFRLDWTSGTHVALTHEGKALLTVNTA
jgi:hypothetical protein